MSKPVPTNAGESSIPTSVPRNSLTAMLARGMTAEDIRNQAPESHRRILPVRTEEEVLAMKAAGLDKPLPPAPKKASGEPVKQRWQRGDQAVDIKHGKVVTILAARERVSEDGIPYHKVAAGGKAWLAKETRLKPIPKK